MHTHDFSHDLSPWTHHHVFDQGNPVAERGTRIVMAVTAIMMVIEIAAGVWFNSMALLADGWHMSTHALAIGLSAFAYAAARRHKSDTRFTFGTWKIEVLAGFASAIFLLGVAVLMVVGSIEHWLARQPIRYQEAMVIAVVGLFVNLLCARILGHAHRYGEADHHDEAHHDGTHHHDAARHHDEADHYGNQARNDFNLRSAYLHVIADAATSVLAIAALAGGLWLGWSWLDPMMGLIGAGLIGVWAVGLIRGTSNVLLDREMDHPIVAAIRRDIETRGKDATRISDLHVWRVGRASFACALTVVTHDPKLTADRVREQLVRHREIMHTTVEINQCR